MCTDKNHIKSIFLSAIEEHTPDHWPSYLDIACGDDAQLRQRVEDLLKNHRAQDPLFDAPDQNTVRLDPLSETPGTIIGRYKLLEKIGEGGMAVVYMAEQEQPIRRQVALKIIKLGMDTKQVIARFEAERQALALMDHPNIAKVLDAGATDSGRPFFVMELVKGVSVTRYCDQQNMGMQERLQLFIQICQAVQHAHQKGIIHRDIKPANIMVTRHDGVPVPKIIDFGIAKAINHRLTEKTLFTCYAQIVGTPTYMSPEQAELSDWDVDARTDLYSLGVLLYELLTGTTPFSEERLREAGYLGLLQIIRQEEPTKPSTVLNTPDDTLTDIARHRALTPDSLSKTIRGDLDWIDMKSLDKDRSRRYETVDALSLDVQRHLHSEPVLARGPSTLYSLTKFLYRHRTTAAAIAVVMVTLSSLGIMLWMMTEDHYRRIETDRLRQRELLSQSRELFTRGDRETALEQVETILDSQHVAPEAQLLYAGILVEGRQYSEALANLEGLVDGRAEIAGAAHTLWARVLWESPSPSAETVKEVEYHRRKAEEILPETAEAYFLRALTAMTIREKLELLDSALRLEPSHYESFRLRVYIHAASRKYQEMKEDAIVMVALRPGDPLGYSLRALARFELGQYPKAIEDFDSAIDLTTDKDPQVAEWITRRCDVLLHMGDYERVVSEGQANLNFIADPVPLQFRIFCALTALGRYPEAAAYHRHLKEQDPGYANKFIDWARKYVYDTLDTGRSWHPADKDPLESVFLPMLKAELTYQHLSKKARRLIKDAGTASWSPDGRKLAFSAGYQRFNGIAVYDMATEETDLLIVPGKDPVWSPDGQTIAFVRECQALPVAQLVEAERLNRGAAHEEEEVWIMNADGTQPRRLAPGNWLSWSGDSQRLYSHEMGTASAIYRISLEDGRVKRKLVVDCPFHGSCVSPDEKYLTYYERNCVRILDLETQSPITSWKTPRAWRWGVGTWSSTSDQVALAIAQAGPEPELWIYDIESRQADRVLVGPVGPANWSPDGKKLVFSMRSPYFELWVADLDSSHATAETLGFDYEAYHGTVLDLYIRVIEANPEDADNYFFRAQYHNYLHDVDSASADMTRFELLQSGGVHASGFQFGVPRKLGPVVNTSAKEYHPLLSADGLSLMFGRQNEEGSYDHWWAFRSSRDAPWQSMELFTTYRPDTHIPAITTADGLELYHSGLDEYGERDLYVRKREIIGDNWGEPENLGPPVNSPARERRPAITADGLELYFMIDHIRPGGHGGHDLWVTTRATRGDSWEEPANLGLPVNSSSHDGWPYISIDGLTLLFGSSRPGGFGSGDLYVSRRASRTDPWGEPVNLGLGVNTPSGDWVPHLSTDGSMLYLESNRTSVHRSMDIWQVPILNRKE